jgi:lipopolysaccharide/colanic/teichoic acid biosynthesis glycosyltransferase
MHIKSPSVGDDLFMSYMSFFWGGHMAFGDYSAATVRARVAGSPSEFCQRSSYGNGGKRFLDVVLVLLTLPISIPLILGMAFLVALDGGKPLYRQKRLGRGGRVFHIVKLRTMVPGADTLLESHLCEDSLARSEWEETQKLRCDPRITRIGRFLRKSSLDELPQLWNVLKGDMALVGPRPMMVDQADLYPGKDYYALRPGITGLWQISERNETSFAERAGFDSKYIASLSLPRDLLILVKTIGVVLRGTGC